IAAPLPVVIGTHATCHDEALRSACGANQTTLESKPERGPRGALVEAGARRAPGAALLGTARSWRGIVPFTHLAREGRMTVTIGRRELLAALGGAAAAWPLAARAQQPKMATIGILVTGNPGPEAFLEGFRVALRAAGLIEGQNIRLEVRSAEGNDSLLPQKATELVRLKVDVIVASLTPAVQAARHATSDIPIVMALAGDPVATGLISSLARPGGNITGVSGAAVETAGTRLELI